MTLRHPDRVTVVEVGPRDGLQNEARQISTTDKIAFVDRLSAAGLPVIEVSAFVSSKWIPRLADAGEVFAGITPRAGVRYPALVPNLAGLERARAAGVREVAIFAASSDGFSLRNLNKNVAASLDEYRGVCARAIEAGIRVRAYLSTAFGCPYDGVVAPQRVATLTAALLAMGAFEVAISDTIGIAHPGQVGAVLDAVAAEAPLSQVALHFHDTRGTALANVLAALDAGITTFDASAGGLGGCPYAPGAAGNLATEDLIYMLDGLGIDSGVDLGAVVSASQFIEPLVGHALPSRYLQAVTAHAPAAPPSRPPADHRSSS
ncbi:MAG: hydroxymethylglutaryl-CoA lyase [Vicinamibacterales bacterium]